VKIKSLAVIGFCAFALTACNSTGIELTTPVEDFKTTAKAEDIRDCINLRDPGAFQTLPFRNGWFVAYRTGMNKMGGVIWQVFLTHEGGLTHVEAKTVVPVDFANDVKPCLDSLPRS